MPLDAAGTLFVLALHGTTPVCEDWYVDPAHDQMTHGDTKVVFRMHGDQLVIEGMERGDSSTTCGSSLDVKETAAGLEVGDARWFRTKAACTTAIAHHARVAMDWQCTLDDPLPERTVAKTRQRFDDVLVYGAIMYAEGACTRVRFEASVPVHADSFDGTMSWRIPGGREEYGYEGNRGDATLTLLGPGETMDDGSGYGMGCAEEVHLDYGTDHVRVEGNLYFDRASCEAGSAREEYRRSWLPKGEDEVAVPLAGGC